MQFKKIQHMIFYFYWQCMEISSIKFYQELFFRNSESKISQKAKKFDFLENYQKC